MHLLTNMASGILIVETTI